MLRAVSRASATAAAISGSSRNTRGSTFSLCELLADRPGLSEVPAVPCSRARLRPRRASSRDGVSSAAPRSRPAELRAPAEASDDERDRDDLAADEVLVEHDQRRPARRRPARG